jgi:hypothetical protein
MRDANQQYPLHQPGGNGPHQPFDDDTEDEFDDRERPQGLLVWCIKSFHKALIIGFMAGIIAAFTGIMLRLPMHLFVSHS